MKDNNFGILYRDKFAQLDLFSNDLTKLKTIQFKKFTPPTPIERDFFFKDLNTIIALSPQTCVPFYNFNLSDLHINNNFLKILLPPVTFRSDSIVSLDLVTQKSINLWKAHSFFNPFSEKNHITRKNITRGDSITNIKDIDLYLTKLNKKNIWSKWGYPKCNVDWTHLNSIDYKKGVGYLVSAPHFSKIFLISEDFKQIVWSIGNSANDTFQINKQIDCLSGQHHAQFTKNNTIILFNNKAPNIEFKCNSNYPQILEIKITNKNKIKVIWEYTYNKISDSRGSVVQLDNGNFLSYFPGTNQKYESLLEIDYNTKKILGKMTIEKNHRWTNYRTYPVSNLGYTTFWGATIESNN